MMREKAERGKVYTDDMDVAGTPRWMAASVMLVACAGFVGLAWYAYHAGTRAMHEDELALVEPDSTPVKEKPADPGGMKFPNQDKTIFDAISDKPRARVAAVERVVPGPEEPVSREELAEAQNEGTKTWINDKLNGDKNAQDALIEKNSQGSPAASPAKPEAGSISPSAGQPAAAQPVESTTLPEVSVQQNQAAPPSPPAAQAAPAAAATGEPSKVELKKAEPETETAKPAATEEKPSGSKKAAASAAKKKASGKGGLIQLGAYRSEEEAKTAWNKLRGKHHELNFANPEIKRADLGEKGVFYRLRTRTPDPKATCQAFTSRGQPCIVVK